MSITDIGKEAAEQSQSGGSAVDPDDYEKFDVTGMSYCKTHPTAAPAGTARALRYFLPGDPDDPETDTDRGYNGLIVDDPFLVADDELEHTVIVENDKQKGDDFKVVDLSDSQTNVLTPTGPADFFDEDEDERPEHDFTTVNGVEFGSNATMYGSVRAYITESEAETMIAEADEADGRQGVDTLDATSPVVTATLRANDITTNADLADSDAETIAEMGDFGVDSLIIKLTGNAGQRATRCLDVCGQPGADVERNDDGEAIINEDSGWPTSNHGLIEYVDDFIENEDGDWVPPRFARDPELRPDIEGQEVSVLLQRRSDVIDDYDGNSYFTTVLAREGADGDWSDITPTDEFSPSDTLVAATEYLEEAYPEKSEVLELREAQGIEVDDDLEERIEEEAAEAN